MAKRHADLFSMFLGYRVSPQPMNWNELYLDARLRAANGITERSWREHKATWTRRDLGAVFVDVIQELVDVPLDQIPHEQLKELLRQVYLGAWDVIPPEFRDF